MLFNSFEFLFIFLPIVLLFFYTANFYKFTDKNNILIISSITFYSFWIFNYIYLILAIVISNFLFGKKLIKSKSFKILLYSIIFNVILLLFFKYYDFLIKNINFIFNSNFKELDLPYPLAISFITFQNIIFLIDCYDSQIKKITFKKYTVFALFFPQLIAGPITRFNIMNNQFNKKIFSFKYSLFSKGIFIISIGLFKKIVIADKLAILVNQNYNVINNLTSIEAWISSICFTLQFYFDFSGYADIAVGLALLFMIQIPFNFNSPLKSTSIIEFWQRWHLTLTSFLTNYIYIPILKNLRVINIKNIAISTTITFFIAGLWHGPSWNFIFFGLWNGLLLIINQILRKYKITSFKFINYVITLISINIGFIFFRTENLNDAFVIIFKLFDFNSLFNQINTSLLIYILSEKVTFLTIIVAFMIISLKKNSNNYIEKFQPKLKFLLATIFMFSFSILYLNRTNEFLYFKF